MKRLELRKRLWLILGVFSAVSAIGGTAALALTALGGMYILSVILALVTGHGFYGTVFYFRALRHTLAMVRCFAAYESGERTYTGIADKAYLTPDGAKYFVSKCKKLGIGDMNGIS